MVDDRKVDLIAVLILAAVLLATVLVSENRGMESSGLTDRQDLLEKRMDQFESKPLIRSKYTTIYSLENEVIVETED